MNEAKTLFHMSISAMFAAFLLAAIMGVIGVSYLMWSLFEKQDKASSQMTAYSNLTAFDNTTLRGSEVESLLTYADSLDIFILFYDVTSSDATFDNNTAVSELRCYYANPATSAFNTVEEIPNTTNSIPICEVLSNKVHGSFAPLSGAKCIDTLAPTVPNLYTYNHDTLVKMLLNQSQLGDTRDGRDGNFGVFKSVLIYRTNSSTDVAGVALVRANSTVTNFCE